MGRHYYVEYGGGLGDVFLQMYTHGTYAALDHLGEDERATIVLITHNPFAQEIFANHPQRQRLDVRTPGYWLPEEDEVNRRRLGLPPFSRATFAPGPPPRHGAVTFYPTASDAATLRALREDPRAAGRPLVVFAVSAGEPHKSMPRALVRRLVTDVTAAGCVPVFVGRTYERNFREELKGFASGETIELIDRLTVPGTARLVQQADAIICCHSSINIVGWMERKPLLLLYPDSIFEEFIRPRTQWAFGVDYAETVHGSFAAYDDGLMERFLMRVEGATRKPLARRGAKTGRIDVRDFLKKLPVTRNAVTGDEYAECDWFNAPNGYPFYVRAAELVRPTSLLEIGAFLGFGLAAFAYGSDTIHRLTAMDNETYIPGSQQVCAENLSFFTGGKRFVTSLEDARGDYDLIHVDADHTFAAALNHMSYAWGLGPRVMLVDDYNFLGDVRRAVDTFAEQHSLPFKVWQSYRGWAVFAQPATFTSLPDAL